MTNVTILQITDEGIKDIVCFIGESIWLLYFIILHRLLSNFAKPSRNQIFQVRYSLTSKLLGCQHWYSPVLCDTNGIKCDVSRTQACPF